MPPVNKPVIATQMESATTEPESSEPQLVTMPHGIPGLSDDTEFLIRDLQPDEASVFQLLESTTDDSVGLIVTVPWLFFPDYTPEVPDEEYYELDIQSVDEAMLFCSVTLEPDTETIYLNLLGPFIVNARTLVGRQVVLADSDYPVRAPVKLELA